MDSLLDGMRVMALMVALFLPPPIEMVARPPNPQADASRGQGGLLPALVGLLAVFVMLAACLG